MPVILKVQEATILTHASALTGVRFGLMPQGLTFMAAIYAIWRAGDQVKLPQQEVFQLLEFGEDVEGLVDLPIKDLIQDVRQIFPEASERAGVVEGPSAVGRVC